MSSVIDDICELLNSYNGRDKVLRLACYTFKLYGCLKNRKEWQAAGSRLSTARLMLRLFDDIPMMRHIYNYGFGKHETSTIAAILGLLANIVDQMFLPVEKACWLHDVGILKLSDDMAYRLETLSTALWAASLYIALVQTGQSIKQLCWSRECLQSTESDSAVRRSIDRRVALQTATAAKLCLDLVHAVSCLPRGYLWGEAVTPTKVAAIATTSSLMGIALYFVKKRFVK
ncbi:hypothetical protein ACJJTC_012597 [Scirpophaga incertulas]